MGQPLRLAGALRCLLCAGLVLETEEHNNAHHHGDGRDGAWKKAEHFHHQPRAAKLRSSDASDGDISSQLRAIANSWVRLFCRVRAETAASG